MSVRQVDEREGLEAMRRFGGPAFPVVVDTTHHGRQVFPGVMLRDFFAAHALAGLTANAYLAECAETDRQSGEVTRERFARAALACADALIAECEKANRV